MTYLQYKAEGNVAGHCVTSFCSMLFNYAVEEMAQILNYCLYQLIYDKINFVKYTIYLKVTEPIKNVK